MAKITTIEVQDRAIRTLTKDGFDYICITDIARQKNPVEPKDVVKNWMRLKNTIEYLGLWESLNNPLFKGVEFDPFEQRIIQTFPQAQIFNRVFQTHPVFNHVFRFYRIFLPCNIGNAYIVKPVFGECPYCPVLYFNSRYLSHFCFSCCFLTRMVIAIGVLLPEPNIFPPSLRESSPLVR